MSKLSKEKIEQLALLSRLKLTDQEKERYQKELSAILSFVEKLEEVKEDIEPIAQITGLENVLREDEIKEWGLPREEILKNAPQVENGYLKVKAVFEEE